MFRESLPIHDLVKLFPISKRPLGEVRIFGCSKKRLRALVIAVSVVVLTGLLMSEEEEQKPQPIRVDVMFELMSNQIVDVVCDAPEFRACFDVPHAECSRKLRRMLADCRADMDDELPELIRSDEADPIIERAYACVIPKWDSLIKNRRTETEECLRAEREAAGEEDT